MEGINKERKDLMPPPPFPQAGLPRLADKSSSAAHRKWERAAGEAACLPLTEEAAAAAAAGAANPPLRRLLPGRLPCPH